MEHFEDDENEIHWTLRQNSSVNLRSPIVKEYGPEKPRTWIEYFSSNEKILTRNI